MRYLSPRFRSIGLMLLACALAVRLIVAPGFMPMAGADGIVISMCTGKGVVDMTVTGEAARHLIDKSAPASPSPQSCAFASLAMATTPEWPAVLVPTALMTPVAAAITPLVCSPHIGVPAPPPPAIGPPALA